MKVKYITSNMPARTIDDDILKVTSYRTARNIPITHNTLPLVMSLIHSSKTDWTLSFGLKFLLKNKIARTAIKSVKQAEKNSTI